MQDIKISDYYYYEIEILKFKSIEAHICKILIVIIY